MRIQDIDKDSKEYKESSWFINRLIEFDTLSHKEIVAICEMAHLLARNLDVSTEETIYKLEK